MAAKESIETTLALMRQDITRMKDDIHEIKNVMQEQVMKFVTREEFEAKLWPVRTLVFGVTGLLLVAVVGAIIRTALSA